MENPEDYVLKKGWHYEKKGEELIVETCPFCGDSNNHFFINNRMGLYQCFKCGESDSGRGNLWQLKQRLGDLPSKVAEAFGEELSYSVVPHTEVEQLHSQLLNDPYALDWLQQRGLTPDTIKAAKFGVAYDNVGRWLSMPYYKGEDCVNVKYRALPPLAKAFRLKPKHEKPLYCCYDIEAAKDVLVVEGEIDRWSAVQMGFKNVVSIPNGADNFSPDHWDSLVNCANIFLILDPDGAGRFGTRKIATRLGAERCFDVRIPNGMDINDILQKYGTEEGAKRLRACIEDAKPFGEGEVVSVNAALKELDDHLSQTGSVETGYSSPWPSFNEVIGLIAPGEVHLLLAIPKTGKTTFALQWLLWLSRHHNIPTLMYCLEMPLWRLTQPLVSMTTMKDRNSLTSLEVKMTRLYMRDVPFYFSSFPKEYTFEYIKEIITYAVKRFGVQVLCFDNLHFLCRSKDNPFNEQAIISRNFKELAGSLGIAIILVVQPRKLPTNQVPGMYDPSGTGSIIADADSLIALWREPISNTDGATDIQQTRESFKPETIVRVPATRYRPGGQTVLYFHGSYATFGEISA